MHKASPIYVALFKGHISVFCTFAFYSSPLNIPFLWLQTGDEVTDLKCFPI